jgi:hypothetical protein
MKCIFSLTDAREWGARGFSARPRMVRVPPRIAALQRSKVRLGSHGPTRQGGVAGVQDHIAAMGTTARYPSLASKVERTGSRFPAGRDPAGSLKCIVPCHGCSDGMRIAQMGFCARARPELAPSATERKSFSSSSVQAGNRG